MNKDTREYEISIENFICDEFSICREERQYALFLYNILRKYSDYKKRREQPQNVKNIFTACHIPENASIDHVFYEVTFMRDFFDINRRMYFSDQCEVTSDKSFNLKLIKYVYEQKHKENNNIVKYSGKEYNLGHNAIEFDNLFINGKNIPDREKDWLKYRVKWMMNAKPDIAVIYHTVEDNLKFLLFIECKFDSKESLYSYTDKKGNTERIGQREIQWNIAKFLCNCYLKSDNGEKIITIAPSMKDNNKSCLANFVRKNCNIDAANSEIAITQLIELNNKIF